MTEAETIRKIQALRQIKPSKEWVFLTKGRIFGQAASEGLNSVHFGRELKTSQKLDILSLFLFGGRPALVAILTAIIVVGAFGFAQNTVPGDFLYQVKKIGEITEVSLTPGSEQAQTHLEIANRRLDDLGRITESNRVKNLSPTIEEFRFNVLEAAKSLNSTSSNPESIKKIVQETQKIRENKLKIEALGIVVGEITELDNALGQLVVRELNDLDGRTLTEAQQVILQAAKDYYQAGNYEKALERILSLSYPQS